MFTPSFVFAFIVATLLGAAFHLVFGGDARRLALFLLAGWIGFAVGQVLGTAFEVNALNMGTLHLFSAMLGALCALFIVLLLTSRRLRKVVSR